MPGRLLPRACRLPATRKPGEVKLAAVVLLDVQRALAVTSRVLPSLKVPVADIWNVHPEQPDVLGVKVRFAGPMATEVSVGLTKNPLQLAAKANVASAAKAQIKRSFDLYKDIFCYGSISIT